jgi:hypothetical protein
MADSYEFLKSHYDRIQAEQRCRCGVRASVSHYCSSLDHAFVGGCKALLQAQDSQPAQVAQPSNHPAFVAGPADAGSHETLQQRAEDLWDEVGGGLCICTISTVGHWCEKCQQRIALIKDALRAASASAPAAPREVGGGSAHVHATGRADADAA